MKKKPISNKAARRLALKIVKGQRRLDELKDLEKILRARFLSEWDRLART